jgi:hypothetical protein
LASKTSALTFSEGHPCLRPGGGPLCGCLINRGASLFIPLFSPKPAKKSELRLTRFPSKNLGKQRPTASPSVCERAEYTFGPRDRQAIVYEILKIFMVHRLIFAQRVMTRAQRVILTHKKTAQTSRFLLPNRLPLPHMRRIDPGSLLLLLETRLYPEQRAGSG